MPYYPPPLFSTIHDYLQPFSTIRTTWTIHFLGLLTIRNYLLFGFSGHFPPGWNASPSGSVHVQDEVSSIKKPAYTITAKINIKEQNAI